MCFLSNRDMNVRVGVCLPRNGNFDLQSYAPRYMASRDSFQQASSLDDLDRTMDGSKYYYDSSTG